MALAFPSGVELLERERQARRQGSGLTAGTLLGEWRLAQVWPKGRTQVAAFSSASLRALQARLTLTAVPGADCGTGALELTNQVRLGALELRFRGPARLQGRRPLLLFWFEQLELRWGARLLLRRALAEPPAGRMPFFALIAAAGTGAPGAGDWLAARGRGGGLALWTRPGADG